MQHLKRILRTSVTHIWIEIGSFYYQNFVKNQQISNFRLWFFSFCHWSVRRPPEAKLTASETSTGYQINSKHHSSHMRCWLSNLHENCSLHKQSNVGGHFLPPPRILNNQKSPHLLGLRNCSQMFLWSNAPNSFCGSVLLWWCLWLKVQWSNVSLVKWVAITILATFESRSVLSLECF